MILQLQEMLEITRKNSNQAKKIRERREWLRMAAYITQCTNTLLRDLELDELEEGMKKIIEHDRIRDEEEQTRRATRSYTSNKKAPWATPVKKDEDQNTLPEKKPLPGTPREASDSDNPASLNSED